MSDVNVDYDAGKINYEGFREAAPYLPDEWETLPEALRQAWATGATRVLEKCAKEADTPRWD
jgi:hypothetical protein